MYTIKRLILGSTAGLIAIGGAQAADLPVKAKAVEYVKVCSLYGAGFWYLPGTDTCIRIGGAIRLDTSFNGNTYELPAWQASATAAGAYGKNWFSDRARFNLNEDTRTATEYGVLRTYANIQMDWQSASNSAIAGGAPVEVDFAFIQFAGFTMGKAVSEYDPQWALTKPTISSGLFSGSNDGTGITQLAYTATFGNGVSGTLSLEDGQPYRTAGVVNTSAATLNFLTQLTPPTGSYGIGNFTGNAVVGDHVPDVVGNLRLDQAWGTLHFGAAVHEVHGTYYGAASTTGHPGDTYGYAFTGAFELKNLPTGAGDSLKVEAGFAHGAAKYVFGGTVDTSGAGRFFRPSGNEAGGSLAVGYVLDGVYSGTNAINGTSINLSNAWEVTAFYEHYWNPIWRTSVFANYSAISYGAGSAQLIAGLSSAAANPAVGFLTVTGGNMNFATAQVGTRTAWTPVKDLTFSADFIYSRMMQNLTGTFTNTGGISGSQTGLGAVYALGNQNVYVGAVQALRSF
jgi:Porin subfamily